MLLPFRIKSPRNCDSFSTQYDESLTTCSSGSNQNEENADLLQLISRTPKKPRKLKTENTIMTETLDDTECEIFRVNNNLCSFSPCGSLFAIAYQANLIVKKTATLDTLHSYMFADIIEYVEWSPNGQYVLCANTKKAIAQIYSIHHPKWRCKLVEGSAGMERITWALNSTHVITTADFNIQISIWSLDSREVTYIQNLKSSANKSLAFSPNGKRLALIATDNGVDSVEIYRTDGWKISRKLLCDKLSAIDGVSWSPNSELLCIWCSICGRSKLLIYSTARESHIGAFSPEDSNTDDPSAESYKGPRGIDKVAWSPSGQLLAIAACNETIALLNYATWKPMLVLRCEPVIGETDYLGKVHRECVVGARDSNVNFGQGEKHTMEEVTDRPINIPIPMNTNSDGLSIATVDIFEFSACGRYLAVRHQVYSSTMWIWDIAEDSVDHLLLKTPVSGVCWNPNSPRLMIFNESPLIFEWWVGRQVTCYPSPRGMTVLSGRWHPRGKILALCGYNKTAIMRLNR